jgi:hypothetical protein
MAAAPGWARNRESVPATVALPSKAGGQTPIALHIQGWSAPVESQAEACPQLSIGISSSWRAVWR